MHNSCIIKTICANQIWKQRENERESKGCYAKPGRFVFSFSSMCKNNSKLHLSIVWWSFRGMNFSTSFFASAQSIAPIFSSSCFSTHSFDIGIVIPAYGPTCSRAFFKMRIERGACWGIGVDLKLDGNFLNVCLISFKPKIKKLSKGVLF